MDVLDCLTFDDLDDDQKELAETIGLDSYKDLIRFYGGTTLYVPKCETIDKTKRNEIICEEFNGTNFRSLAIKYNLTDRQIRSIVKDRIKELKNKPADGQITMFDILN